MIAHLFSKEIRLLSPQNHGLCNRRGLKMLNEYFKCEYCNELSLTTFQVTAPQCDSCGSIEGELINKCISED